MCGIVGAVGQRDIADVLVEGLKRLEYRGYDSAGIAIINSEMRLERVRALGKVQNLVKAVKDEELSGSCGIAHTRWATHGKPSEVNAHPHTSHEKIALVHNGIIENHDELKQQLGELGYQFDSETDTEIAAHLIHYYYKKHNDLLKAASNAAKEMDGAFALGVIHEQDAGLIVAIRKGSPLVIGKGMGENFIASDAMALRGYVKSVCYLEEGDAACIRSDKISIYNKTGECVSRTFQELNGVIGPVDKGEYRHFMLKEIYEQAEVLTDVIQERVSQTQVFPQCFGEKAPDLFAKTRQIHIVACGTSYHAGLVAKYWLESLANIPTQVEVASEYRYRDIVVPENTLFITVSQSGETADTLAALRKAKQLNYLSTLAICNVATSSLVRESECVFLTRAGTEIGVASTKAFTTQLVSFLMLASCLVKNESQTDLLKQLHELPAVCEQLLALDKSIETLANDFVDKNHALFLGRGVHYPIALEGALKLKEISYIHAEAYPAGELKHGPLALVDKEMPVVAVAPNDELLDKLKSNLHEVKARGGELYVFADSEINLSNNSFNLLKMPAVGKWIAPIAYTIPLQLLAYHVAVLKGTDVDQPRNLAKSVTVE
jgi:glutamine---fructose-6-phosphate transaminase (isomerizing)